jgi:hypothetical protein
VATAGCVLALSVLSAASGAAATSSLPTLTLALNGKTVTVGGSTVSGAVKIATTVSGESTGSAALVRLNPGIPFADFAKAAAAVNSHHGDINYLDPYGAIVFDQPVSKGANVAQTTLAPGNYFALDIGGRQAAPPHAAFVVTQATAPAALPAAGATVKTIEFGFRGAGTLHNGELVRFENGGFLGHMILAVHARSLAAARTVTSLLRAGKDNKVGKKLAAGFADFVDALSPGGVSQYVIHQSPGIYVLLCFMNTQDGREHTQLGMERTIKITK